MFRRIATELLTLKTRNLGCLTNSSPVSAVPCVRLLHLQPPAHTTEPPVTHEEQVQQQQALNEVRGSYIELVRDFLEPGVFFNCLAKHGVDFFCGVPDSLLKDFCAYVTSHVPPERHVIAANEGTAVSIAAGYHLATSKYGLVYLQNSGLGNTINPLLSMASSKVYSVPMLLMIGWRGEPGKRDEPQHMVQGAITPGLLAAADIPFQTLPDYMEGAEQVLKAARQHMETVGGPYALLVKRQTFLPYKLPKPEIQLSMTREDAMQEVVSTLHSQDVVVSTTGMLSRELFEYRAAEDQGHHRDFLCVGSMGHASSIAMGIAKFKQRRTVWCLDGDGAAIMHMGALANIGGSELPNLRHVLINNGAHDSVGGQPTEGERSNLRFDVIAKACGYTEAWTVDNKEDLHEAIEKMKHSFGPTFLEIKVRPGNRTDLGRPTSSPHDNKADFMHFLASGE